MAPQPVPENSQRSRWGWGMVVVSLVVGLGASIYLLVSHLRLKTGQALVGLCDISESVNCRAALESQFSSLFNVPLPVWAIGFYTSMLALALRAGTRGARQGPGWAVVTGGLALAFIYSMFLLIVLVFSLRVLCPGCLILDAVNTVALVGAIWAGGRTPQKTLAVWPQHVRAALMGREGLVFAIAFGASFLIAAVVSLQQLDAPEEDVPPDRAFDIVVNYPYRNEIPGVAQAPSRGPDAARVVIVEFSDFECPFCRRHAQTLHELQERHPADVQVRFMHYPLNEDCNPHVEGQFHEAACNAARAGVCAQDQRKFWEMHDLMFESAPSLDRDDLVEMAGSLGLDVDEFQACLDSEYSLQRVLEDVSSARVAIANSGEDRVGTPFSFFNGLLVRGARTAGQLEALIQAEIEAAGTGEGTGETASQR